MNLDTIQKVPLTIWEDGTIRVKDSRLLVDMIVDAHNRGECPEEIFESFPSDTYSVADIYSIISYYLTHKKEFDDYIAVRDKEAIEIRLKIEATQGYIEKGENLREKLIERLKIRNK